MKKSIKGAIATGGAAVLLLGGAGSLAYWTDAATVNGGTVNSGFLTLDDGVCDDAVYAVGNAKAGVDVINWVPGDAISVDCTFVIAAEGDNLAATPEIPDTVTITGGGASFKADVAATYTLNDVAFVATDKVTEANDGQSLVATIKVSFPYGTDETGTPIVNGNDTQDVDAVLDDLTVTLTQDDPNA